MSRTALYQKYRSQSFDEVVGQEYVVQSIKNAIKMGKIGHAYLFCGPRGTGKTSMARLLARAVNCENPLEAPCGHCESCMAAMEGNHPDIIEVNAANETHVDDIRDLIERAQLAPMMSKHKVYIIDEVHQLSSSAASALLKTLEEPPEHVIFILATTDPQKLINTIISRCQRFDFTRVSLNQIKDHMLSVAESEGFVLEEKAALKIAELADGGMRDALSILEQVSSYAGDTITEEQINRVYGLSTNEQKLNLLACIYNGDLQGILTKIQQYENSGMDLKRLTSDLIDCLKDGVIIRYTNDATLLRKLSAEEANQIASSAPADLSLRMADRFIKALEQYKQGQSVTTLLELACMEMLAWNDQDNTSRISTPALQPTRPTVSEKPVTVPTEIKKSEPVVEVEKPSQVIESTGDQTPVVQETFDLPTPEEPKDVVTVNEPEACLSEDEVVSLLVQCDKENRAFVEEALNTIKMAKDRYSAALLQCKVGGAGKDCLLLHGPDFVADTCDEDFNKELYFYLKEMGVDRMPFIVHTDVYDRAVDLFKKKWADHNLPQPMEIVRYQATETKKEKQEDPLDKVFDLFGEDIVEIVEGE